MTIDDHIPNTAKPIKPHPDDAAVDNFAVAMKEKLAIITGPEVERIIQQIEKARGQ